ncbi:MAG: ornithine cyclodeaminase family protein [Muribaculaceae bacterium]|nr:ornithine cyclodeaminase family protein [Muribaculaceae bacterium]
MKLISHNDLLRAGCFDVSLGIRVTEEALLQYHNNDVIFPDKVSQIFNQEEQTRINCLPATIRSKNVCGMKWVAVFPPNPVKYGCPNLNASILLSETITGYPIAFMDGTLCSDIRTASVSAVAAKHLARKDSEVIGFLGAGEQARMHLLAFAKVLPNLKVCKVASRTSKTEKKFIESMSKMLPNLKFIACDTDFEKAARDSDVIVTAISAQTPLLKADWIKEGTYYNHVGGWEDEYDVPKKADKIICDDWNSVKHRTQTVSRLYQTGELTDEDIHANLHEIVAGEKAGRENDKEIIYFNPVGLSYVDVALANEFYEMAKESIPDLPIFDFKQSSIFE